LLLYLKVYWYTKCSCQVLLANLTFFFGKDPPSRPSTLV
jgi:hypothetical protein